MVPEELEAVDTEALQQLRQHGYCVFKSAYNDDEVAWMRRTLMEAYDGLGRPALRASPPVRPAEDVEVGPAGLIFHKLTRRWPEMAARLYKPHIIATMRALMGGLVLELPAGVLNDASRPFFDWHVHIDGADDAYYKNQRPYPRFTRSERVIHLLYLDDMHEEMGRLLVYPRRITDPTEPPFERTLQWWQGAVEVDCPRGSVVVLEQCTWHAARCMTTEGIRAFVGSYFASGRGASTPLADPDLADWKGDDPLFRSMLPKRS